jgi:hypothetical protein
MGFLAITLLIPTRSTLAIARACLPPNWSMLDSSSYPISHRTSPTITTPVEFETWWTTSESLAPNLHLHRSNVGHLFYSLAITPEGNGASYFISTTPATDSGGGLLPTHNAFHLVGTMIGFDEAATYSLTEVQFALTTNTAYWFDPLCSATKQWNPLDPSC